MLSYFRVVLRIDRGARHDLGGGGRADCSGSE